MLLQSVQSALLLQGLGMVECALNDEAAVQEVCQRYSTAC